MRHFLAFSSDASVHFNLVRSPTSLEYRSSVMDTSSLYFGVKLIHFHNFLFGFSPFQFHFDGKRVTVKYRVIYFLPTVASMAIGLFVWLNSTKFNLVGIETNLKIVNISKQLMQQGLLLLYVGTTVLSFSLRNRFAQLFMNVYKFDQEVISSDTNHTKNK